MHQQKVSHKFKWLLEAAARLVSYNKAELIGERKALMSTKGTICNNNAEVTSSLHAEHVHVKEYITKPEVPGVFVSWGHI